MADGTNRIPGKGPPGVREISTFQMENPNILKYVPRPFWPTFTDSKQTQWFKTPLGNALYKGADNLAALFANPGGMSPGISAAINPQLTSETSRIQRQTGNQMSAAAGSMARSGIGGGIAEALQRAIERAGQRDIAGSKRNLMTQSEQLRRQDLSTMMDYLRFITDATLQGRNIQLGRSAQTMQQQQNQQAQKNQQQAAWLSLAGAMFGGGV